MTATVKLLGIRHHGPGSARSVVRALDALQPSVVLVELPADCEASLAWVGDEHLVPPVALLGYVVDRPQRAAFLPFAEFSPEWQAFTWAKRNDVVIRAMDLPLQQSLAGSGDGDDELPLSDLQLTESHRRSARGIGRGGGRSGPGAMVGRRDRAPRRR